MLRLVRELQKRSESDPEGIIKKLDLLAEETVKDATDHVKLIIKQLPEFDLHDQEHGYAVATNMENLLGEQVENLSGYECFLLLLSAFLHDIGMALPEWELRLLTITEGTDEFGASDDSLALKNDLKPPMKITEALSFIKSNSKEIYSDFKKVKQWPFSAEEEDAFVKDLARRLIEYQNYRNGYASVIKKVQKKRNKNDYEMINNEIRANFVRESHHLRSADLIRNLAPRFKSYLGGAWGEALVRDLSDICRVHGEDFIAVSSLKVDATYKGNDTANLAFLLFC